MTIILDKAKKMLSAGIQQAQVAGKPCSIAIVDGSGWLVALHRMDGAPMATANIARDKAWSACAFEMPSSEISSFGDASKAGFSLNPTKWNDQITTLPGGLPVEVDGKLIGGIGVSGGTAEQDIAICKAAKKALEE